MRRPIGSGPDTHLMAAIAEALAEKGAPTMSDLTEKLMSLRITYPMSIRIKLSGPWQIDTVDT